MHRCYVDPDAWSDTSVDVSDSEAHHLFHVLRAQPEDLVRVFDGAGRSADARVGSSPVALLLEPGSVTRAERSYSCTLMLSVIRSTRMDWAIEKATELGVAAIQPIITERCVVKIKPDDRTRKRERWVRIAMGAAKQCGTPWLPAIHDPLPLTDALPVADALSHQFVAALSEEQWSLYAGICAIREEPSPSVGIWIGPEGDFTDEELALIQDRGAVPVTLGPLVLRAETASLAALSVIAAGLSG